MIYKAHELPGFRPSWVIHDTAHDCWYKTEIGKKTYWVMTADNAYRFTMRKEIEGVIERLEKRNAMNNRHRYEHGINDFTRFIDRAVEVCAPWLCGATVLYLAWHVWRAIW